MKLRNWIWSAIVLVLLVAFIAPSVAYRHRNEEKNKYYTMAIDASYFAQEVPIKTLRPYLKKLKAAGVTAAVIREETKGYPKALIEEMEQAGLQIALQPDVRNASFSNLEKLIERYGVTHIKLHTNIWSVKPEPPEKRAEICRLIREKKLTLVLTETIEQLSNYHPEGFDEYLSASEGRVVRSFTGYTETYAHNGEYPYGYYHFLNSALDHNIRFLIAVPLLDQGFTEQENEARLLASIEKFCKKIEEEGFSSAPAPALFDYSPKRTLPSAACAAISVIMLAVIAELFFKKEKRWLLPASVLAAALVFGLTFLLPDGWVLLYPTVFAPIAGCFCTAVIFEMIRLQKSRGNLWTALLSTLGAALVLMLLCGLCQGAMMNGWDYYLNEVYYKGVKLALILPVVFGFFWLTKEQLFALRLSSLKNGWKTVKSKLRWHYLAVLLLGIFLAGLYIIRSGNVSSISFFELKFRNGLTNWLLARPRTKDFLFGWPFLILLVYEWRREGNSKLLCWIFGTIAAVLFASGINTFSHAFTPIETMVLRDLYGMLFGMGTGALALALYRGILSLVMHIKNRKKCAK